MLFFIMSTEAQELLCIISCNIAALTISYDIIFNKLQIKHFLLLPAITFGWVNGLAIKAISETIGIHNTNLAIFGQNFCHC